MTLRIPQQSVNQKEALNMKKLYECFMLLLCLGKCVLSKQILLNMDHKRPGFLLFTSHWTFY